MKKGKGKEESFHVPGVEQSQINNEKRPNVYFLQTYTLREKGRRKKVHMKNQVMIDKNITFHEL